MSSTRFAEAADMARRSSNQLLLAVLGAAAGPAVTARPLLGGYCGSSRHRGLARGGASCRRFPRVGATVWRSLSTTNLPAPTSRVPRLSLGTALGDKRVPTSDPGCDALRKRLGGCNPGHATGNHRRPSSMVPQSARLERPSDFSPDRGNELTMSLPPARRGHLDEPAALSLEDDVINPYDPHNDVTRESNYQLPDHQYRLLMLQQYRQDCSEVVPNAVYIAGHQVAGDLDCLRRHQITHIVNMAADICDSSFPDHFRYLTYYLKDTNSEDISPLFYRTLDWMQRAVDTGGRVLVHCREGVSRSATMVLAYVMWRQGLSFEVAFQNLRKVRPICNPNTGFTCQLLLLSRRLGIAGCGQAVGMEKTLLFRVAPHNSKEPFLILMPVQWPRSWPFFDSRFGWVVQRGSKLLLWLGSQVPDPDAVQAAVQQHVRLTEVFEQLSVDLTVLQEGTDLSQLLQVLATAPCGAPPSSCGLATINPALDAEHEVLQAGVTGGSFITRNQEARLSSAEALVPSPVSSGVSASAVQVIGGG